MACRLHNLHDKTLGIDLRGGEVLLLPPNTTSRAIVEEALYDNHHLSEWERAGWVRRLPARMGDVIAEASAMFGFDPRAEEFERHRAEAIEKTKAASAERKDAADADAADDAAAKPRAKADKKSEK